MDCAEAWRTVGRWQSDVLYRLGNVQLLYYRADLLKQAGLAPPKTWDDVLAAAQADDSRRKHTGSSRAASAQRCRSTDERDAGGSRVVVKDPAAGDYPVTINSPQAKAAPICISTC